MNYTKYKSIKEISLEIGVVRQTIHNYINTEPSKSELQPHIKHIGNRILIHSNGVELIKSFNEKGTLDNLGGLDSNGKNNIDNLDSLDDNGKSKLDSLDGDGRNNIDDLDDKKPEESKKSQSTSPVDDMTMNYINSLKDQISILKTDKEHYQEESKKQSARISDLAEKLAELTRNSQVLLKQEQDKSTLLLPEQNEKRHFWQFWKK